VHYGVVVHRLVVYISDEAYELLRRASFERGVSMSALVREGFLAGVSAEKIPDQGKNEKLNTARQALQQAEDKNFNWGS